MSPATVSKKPKRRQDAVWETNGPVKVPASSPRSSRTSTWGTSDPVGCSVPSVYQKDVGLQGLKAQSGSKPSSIVADVPLTKAEQRKRLQRKRRFSTGTSCPSTGRTTGAADMISVPGPLYEAHTASYASTDPPDIGFVGTNQSLEKSYLRLTDFPKPQDVRPLPVLIQSLAHIKATYIQTEDFEWANDQLKSVRQDITVQPSIRNQFVLDVYETHARILLEHGDLDEFHKCQTVLQSLTSGSGGCCDAGGLAGPLEEGPTHTLPHPRLTQSPSAAEEFLAYSILYATIRNSSMDLHSLVARAKQRRGITSREGSAGPRLHHSSSAHALEVLLAVQECDFHRFFQLYSCAPHLSAYLMDFLVQRVRESALQRILAAYRPSVSVEQLRAWLWFADLEETRAYLRQMGAVFVKERGSRDMLFHVDCKASLARR